MDITARAKEELDKGVHKIENFIAERGIGSDRLTKARKMQRNVNLAVVVGGIIAVAGLAAWAINKSNNR